MESVATLTAKESRSFAVPFKSMPAVGALLGGVSGIHEQNMLSRSSGLITCKRLMLAERPAIELAVELSASFRPFSDLAHVFKSKCSVFRVHNLPGYAMIRISHKPSFPAGHSLQLAFGRAGVIGQQLFSKVVITSAPVFDLIGIEESPATLVSQPEPECYRPESIIYVGVWNVSALWSKFER